MAHATHHFTSFLKAPLLTLAAFAAFGLSAKSQDMISNPLSRLGYGTSQETVTTAWRSMGGVGIGLNDPKVINLKNPAAFGGTDSLSFLIDAGVSVNMGIFDDGTASRTTFLGGLDYLALQFPLYKNIIGFSAGIKPFSSAGYGLVTSTPIGSDGRAMMLQTFTGSGTLQKAYAGLGFRLWDRLFVGASANYLFGSLTHTVNTRPTSTVLSESLISNGIRLSDWSVDVGLQYRAALRNKEEDYMIFGLTYTPSMPLRPRFTEIETTNINDPLRQTINQRVLEAETALPHEFGIGWSWNRPNKYALAADLSYSMWSKVPNVFGGDGTDLSDVLKAALGFEFVPDAFSRDYGKVMKYRFGLNYSNGYIGYTGGGKTHNIGAAFGLGMPVNIFGGELGSVVNLGIDYTHSFITGGLPVKNDILRLSLSLTFNETWFRELKIY